MTNATTPSPPPGAARPRLVAAVAALLAAAALHATAAAQTLGDFHIPEQQPGPAAAAAPPPPESVTAAPNKRLGQTVIAGARPATAVQDAINAARQELLSQRNPSGARFVATPSGLGLVAVGSASYTESPDNTNPNLEHLDRRRAATEARLAALRAIAETLNGLSIEARTALAEQQTALDLPAAAQTEIDRHTLERTRQLTSAFLRGVVTYTAHDDQHTNSVTVTVVTTPKTQGQIARLTPGIVTARSLDAGMNAVFADLAARTTPPVGGTAVTVPDTGETAWIGFGSAIIRPHPSPAVERRHEETALRLARLRADAALAAIITGDDLDASDTLVSSFAEQTAALDAAIAEHADPDAAAAEHERLTRTARTTFNAEINTETVATLRGVQRRTYRSPDDRWLWTVAVYTTQADRLTDNPQPNPLGDTTRRSRGFEINPDGSFRRDDRGRLIPRSLGSGTITNPEDL